MTPKEFSIHPSFEEFKSDYDLGIGTLAWVKRIDDVETPVSALAKLGADSFGSCIFESVEGGETRGRYSIVAVSPDLIFEIDENGAKISILNSDGNFGPFTGLAESPVEALRNIIKDSKLKFPAELPPPLAGLYGYLSYEVIRYFEKLPQNKRDPMALPYSILTRPRLVIVFDGVKQELLLATPIRKTELDAENAYNEARARLYATTKKLDSSSQIKAPKQNHISASQISASANQSKQEYIDGVEKAKAYIKAGDIFQVVPSIRYSIDYTGTSLALYRALRRTNPSPFLFRLQFDDFAIVGSSPEILVRLRDGTVTIRPIAGTKPRGATNALDIQNEEDLLSDPKECAEHLMLLDLGRNDVGRVCVSKTQGNSKVQFGGIRVTQKFIVERYSHVMHIVSNVEGTIKPELDALDALLAGFPAGTVSGAPKIRAMEIIAELEPHERGVYGGGVGYFSANGDMDICIALRTGIIKDKKLYVQAGAGVVLDSNPESEHQECVNKARALMVAANEAINYD